MIRVFGQRLCIAGSASSARATTTSALRLIGGRLCLVGDAKASASVVRNTTLASHAAQPAAGASFASARAVRLAAAAAICAVGAATAAEWSSRPSLETQLDFGRDARKGAAKVRLVKDQARAAADALALEETVVEVRQLRAILDGELRKKSNEEADAKRSVARQAAASVVSVFDPLGLLSSSSQHRESINPKFVRRCADTTDLASSEELVEFRKALNAAKASAGDQFFLLQAECATAAAGMLTTNTQVLAALTDATRV